MFNAIFIFPLYRHLVDKDSRQQVNVLLSNIFRVFLGGELNPPQSPLCVLERLERGKMKVGGGKWMGKGKDPSFSLLPLPTMCLLFLNYCHFLLGYLACDWSLCGGERRWNYDVCRLFRLLWLKPQLFRLSGSRVNVACHAGVLRVSSHIPASRTSLLWDRNVWQTPKNVCVRG